MEAGNCIFKVTKYMVFVLHIYLTPLTMNHFTYSRNILLKNHNTGPSQFSLRSRPNHDCLWGKETSFSFTKPPLWRCCMNLSTLC